MERLSSRGRTWSIGAAALAIALGCGGGAPPWAGVAVPAGGSVVSDTAEGRLIEHTGDVAAIRRTYAAAIEAAGCDERAYPGGWRKGLIGHYRCAGSRFEVVAEAGEPVRVRFEPVGDPAPAPLAVDVPWHAAPAPPAAEALAATVSCPAQNHLVYAPDGTIAGGDPEDQGYAWRGRWALEGGALVVSGAREPTSGDEADPSEDPGPPARCEGARLHGSAPRTTWLCADHIGACEGHPSAPEVWILVRGDEAARDRAGRALVALWQGGEDVRVVSAEGSAPASGVEVRWRPQPGSPPVDGHRLAALQALSVIERDLAVAAVSLVKDDGAEAPVVVSVGADVVEAAR